MQPSLVQSSISHKVPESYQELVTECRIRSKSGALLGMSQNNKFKREE